MNNDLALIYSLQQGFKSATLDFCSAVNDLAKTNSAQIILSLLESHFLIVQKLAKNAECTKNYSESKDDKKAVLADIHEFLQEQS